MKIHFTSFIPSVLLCLSLLSAPGLAGEITLQDAYVREPVPGQSVSAGFFTLTNNLSRDCQLMAAASPVAKRVEVHEHRHKDGMMQMRPVAQLTIGGGDTQVFRPGGYHLMLFDLQGSFDDGDEIEISLDFGDCGYVRSSFRVRSLRHE